MRTGWKIALQAGVTLLLLAWLAAHFEWRHALRALSTVQPYWFGLAVLLYLLNLILSALRWHRIMHSLRRPMPLSLLLRLNWVGAFFNQILPGAVSGDAVRAYYSYPHTRSFTLALAAVLSERVLGLGALLVLAAGAFGVGNAGMRFPGHLGWLILALCLAYGAAVALILSPHLDPWMHRLGRLGRKAHEARVAFRALFRHAPDLAWVLVLSLLVQVLSVCMFWAVSLALHLELSPFGIWVLWPIISLMTFIPISLAGWGVREGLVVFYFTQLGVAGDKALALSLLAGFAVLLASLPGGLQWLLLGRKSGLKNVLDLKHEN